MPEIQRRCERVIATSALQSDGCLERALKLTRGHKDSGTGMLPFPLTSHPTHLTSILHNPKSMLHNSLLSSLHQAEGETPCSLCRSVTAGSLRKARTGAPDRAAPKWAPRKPCQAAPWGAAPGHGGVSEKTAPGGKAGPPQGLPGSQLDLWGLPPLCTLCGILQTRQAPHITGCRIGVMQIVQCPRLKCDDKCQLHTRQ